MVKVKEHYGNDYVNSRLLAAVTQLDMIREFVDPSEKELLKKLDDIICDIVTLHTY